MLARVGAAALWTIFAFVAWTQAHEIYRNNRQGTDFEAALWIPAQRLLDGLNPYGPALDPSSYPPSAVVSIIPLSWLSLSSAIVVTQVALALVAFGTLWVLEVRDWRCYAIWFLTPPVLEGVLLGNTTILVAFLVALVWRFRAEAARAGCALAVAVLTKLFVAPLVVWFLFTRRFRAAAVAAGVVAIVMAISWLVVGLEYVDDYRRNVGAATDTYQARGPLLQGFLRQIGLTEEEATLGGLIVAGLLLAVAWLRRRDDLVSFGCAAAACVAVTPIAWNHYVTVLVVPLAVTRPRFSRVWLALALFWFGWWHTQIGYGSLGRTLPSLTACVLLVAIPLLRKRAATPTPAPTLA